MNVNMRRGRRPNFLRIQQKYLGYEENCRNSIGIDLISRRLIDD
jgi:hypothetical protein